MENLELNYEMGGTRNFLSASVAEEINTYQLKMIEYNKISGILPISARMLNGEYKLLYDITGKSRLADVLKKGDCVGEAARKVLYSIAYALVHAEDYLLTYRQFLLEKEYIFMDAAGDVAFVYLPLSNRTVTGPEEIRNFLKNLLVEHFTADGDAFFLNLLRYVNMAEYSLSGIMERLEQGVVSAPQKSLEREPQKPVSALKRESTFDRPKINPVSEEKQERSDPKEKKAEQPVFGFAVPGMDAFMTAGKKEEKGKEKEKIKGKRPSLFNPFKSREKEKKEEVIVGHEVFEKKPVKRSETGEEGNWVGTRICTGASEMRETMFVTDDSVGIKIDGKRVEFQHFPFVIGRVEGDYIIECMRVSGKHLYFTEENGHYYVTDDNSTNHTYVNGKVIAPYTPTEVSDGDSIRLADVEATFYIDK